MTNNSDIRPWVTIGEASNSVLAKLLEQMKNNEKTYNRTVSVGSNASAQGEIEEPRSGDTGSQLAEPSA
jgi:hypothetical protein